MTVVVDLVVVVAGMTIEEHPFAIKQLIHDDNTIASVKRRHQAGTSIVDYFGLEVEKNLNSSPKRDDAANLEWWACRSDSPGDIAE